jgi:hypothetical protein
MTDGNHSIQTMRVSLAQAGRPATVERRIIPYKPIVIALGAPFLVLLPIAIIYAYGSDPSVQSAKVVTVCFCLLLVQLFAGLTMLAVKARDWLAGRGLKVGLGTLFVCFIAFEFFGSVWHQSTASPEQLAAEARAEMCSGPLDRGIARGMAIYEAEDFIKDHLRAPTTASFPSEREFRVTRGGNCEFDVAGYVDSQNAFGAMIRSDVSIHLIYGGRQPDDDTLWRARDVSIDAR